MTTKEFVWYHEAIVTIYEPSITKKVGNTKTSKGGKILIPESVLYNKEVHFFDDKKITLKSKDKKLTEILQRTQLQLGINDKYKLRFKEITKCKKL